MWFGQTNGALFVRKIPLTPTKVHAMPSHATPAHLSLASARLRSAIAPNPSPCPCASRHASRRVPTPMHDADHATCTSPDSVHRSGHRSASAQVPSPSGSRGDGCWLGSHASTPSRRKQAQPASDRMTPRHTRDRSVFCASQLGPVSVTSIVLTHVSITNPIWI